MEILGGPSPVADRSSDDDLRTFLGGPGRRDPRLRWGSGEVDYDDVLARAEQTFSLFFAEGRPVQEPPGVLLAELAPGASLEELDLPSLDLRRAIPTLTKWLIARSHAVRFGDPQEMLHWGLMARLAADSCSVQALGSRSRLADLKARAWGQFGNALRVCGRFREAGEMLAAAREYLEKGTGDPVLRARFYEQMASLHINQKAFESARELLEEAQAIYEEIGERHCLAGSLLQKAITLQYGSEPELAIQVIDRAVAFLNPIEDPDLFLVASGNRALAYISIDRPDWALSSFRALRRAGRGNLRSALMLRVSWAEGQALSGLGHLEAAETALRSARRGFIERDLAPEVVAASRDLVGLYRKMGKRRALEDTVVETQALFFGIPAEVEVQNGLRELERMAVL
jgi:tetratricopeptide (TPR) repeat protein